MTAPKLDPDELAELTEQRTFLLRSLADLEREHDVGDLDDADYATLRDDYTARAAEVLRAIDEKREAFATNRRPRRPGRLIASGVVVVALAVGAGVWVAHASGTRNAGQTITGNAKVAANGDSGAVGATGTTVSAAQAAAAKCIPKITSDTLAALKCFQAVLDDHPDDPTALTYRGWALTLASQAASDPTQVRELGDAAETSLKKAIAAAPTLGDPHAFLAILYANAQRCDDARAQLSELDKLDLPDDSQIMQLVDQQLRPKLTSTACPSG